MTTTNSFESDTAFHPDITAWLRNLDRLGIEVPTWSRRHTGPGQYVLFPLQRRADEISPYGSDVQVWAVPEDEWSPGDHVEIGPLPGLVRIVYEIAETYAQRQMVVAPVEVNW